MKVGILSELICYLGWFLEFRGRVESKLLGLQDVHHVHTYVLLLILWNDTQGCGSFNSFRVRQYQPVVQYTPYSQWVLPGLRDQSTDQSTASSLSTTL